VEPISPLRELVRSKIAHYMFLKNRLLIGISEEFTNAEIDSQGWPEHLMNVVFDNPTELTGTGLDRYGKAIQMANGLLGEEIDGCEDFTP